MLLVGMFVLCLVSSSSPTDTTSSIHGFYTSSSPLTYTAQTYDVAVIDDIQMIGDNERGHAWTRCVRMYICADVHVCLCIYMCVSVPPSCCPTPNPLSPPINRARLKPQFLPLISYGMYMYIIGRCWGSARGRSTCAGGPRPSTWSRGCARPRGTISRYVILDVNCGWWVGLLDLNCGWWVGYGRLAILGSGEGRGEPKG